MKRILIIEDDQIVANVYRNKLAVEGYKVETSPDGENGLKITDVIKDRLQSVMDGKLADEPERVLADMAADVNALLPKK